MKEKTNTILEVATRRMVLFAIIFTAVGYGIEVWNLTSGLDIKRLILEGATTTLFIVLAILLFFKKISIRKATIWLIYPSILNIGVFHFSHIDNPHIDSMFLRDLLFSLLHIILSSYALNRRHNIVITSLFGTLIISLSLISQNEFLIANLASVFLIFTGGCFIVNVFSDILQSTFQKYISSQEKVEELSNYKQNLVSHIIHDLKVPVNSILDLSNKNNDSILNRIHDSANDRNKQITNILDVERLENTEIELHTQSIETENLIAKAIKGVEVLALNKQIAIHKHYETHGLLTCDNELIHRVFINLLSNAIKHSPAGSTITIKTSPYNEGCKASFIDNGEGIRPENLDKVFDKFFHIASNHTSAKTSNGLGLTFCKLAMQAHNGSIQVQSEYGEGSCFELFFPHFIPSETSLTNENTESYSLTLTKSDKKQLAETVTQLRKTAIYKISDIVELLSPYTNNTSKNIQQWANLVLEAAYSGDDNSYKTLLEGF